MKILVCNAIDTYFLETRDIRAFSYRGLWFLGPDDLAVTSGLPPADFLDHISLIVGQRGRCQVIAAPNNEGIPILESSDLHSSSIVKRVSELASVVNDLDALWPTFAVAELARRGGVEDKCLWANFVNEDGANLVNNKALFRAHARLLTIPIAEGGSTYTAEAAIAIAERLLKKYTAVILKRAHGGAGAANILFYGQGFDNDPAASGAKRAIALSSNGNDLPSSIRSHWEFLSRAGRFPVVVEAYLPNDGTFYVEYFIHDHGYDLPNFGQLFFGHNSLSHEQLPSSPPGEGRSTLEAIGNRVAQYLFQLGYRGYVSLDSILAKNGTIVATEINSRYTSSTHLYRLKERLLTESCDKNKTVSQFITPDAWDSVSQFEDVLRKRGLLFDRAKGEGCLILTPPLGSAKDPAPLFVNWIHGPGEPVKPLFQALAR